MDVMNNPWDVSSLEAFLHYNCPECEDKYSTKEQFVCHAMMVHEKARDALPGILQVQNNIAISNVQSVIEQENCDEVKSDLESSISIEKVEPMSDTEIDENCDASNIELSSKASDHDEEEDLSEYERLRLKNIAERQAKFNELTKIGHKVLNLGASSSNTAAVSDTETDENCDTSNIEPVRIQLSKKRKKKQLKYIDNAFNCKQCEKDFSSKYYLMEHVQRVHEGISLKCDQCSKTYSSNLGLDYHIQKVHHVSLTYKCEQCDAIFQSKRHRRKHVKSVHESVSLKCDQCPKTYTSKTELRAHINFVHKGWTHSYKCDQCPKTYNSKPELCSHIDFIHKGLTRSYKCEQCDSVFQAILTLKEHVQCAHEGVPFKCIQCSKTFNSSNGLRRHVQTIHNGVTFNCDQCPKTYTTKFALRVHTQFVHKNSTNKC